MNISFFLCFITFTTVQLIQSYVHTRIVQCQSTKTTFSSGSFKSSISPHNRVDRTISKTFLLDSTSGLDSETLGALGDTSDLTIDNVDGVIEVATPVASILTKLVASPAILAVPIGAGFLVAFGIGFFIYWYGRGAD